jgi:hypothetical protein
MIKYEVFDNENGQSFIKRFNDDNSISFIPKDESNSDYQEYLNKDKAEQSTPMVTDEATTL